MSVRMITAVATALAALSTTATAHANTVDSFDFQSPSGNIGCSITDFRDGTGAASCKLHQHRWAVAPADSCPEPGQTGGDDLILNRGRAACVGVNPSQIWLAQEWNALPTLGYGQSHTLGAITCASEPSGVRCADTRSGHSFDVSHDSYELG